MIDSQDVYYKPIQIYIGSGLSLIRGDSAPIESTSCGQSNSELRESIIRQRFRYLNAASEDREDAFCSYIDSLMKLSNHISIQFLTKAWSKEDKHILKSVWNNKSEPAHLRANALLTWASFFRADCYYDEAQASARLALRIVRNAPEFYMPQAQKIASAAYAQLLVSFGRALHFLEHLPNFFAGATRCDVCGTRADDLGLLVLPCCVACKLTFYCSSECQNLDWKQGHKNMCRKKGEFKVGDVALYAPRNAILDKGTVLLILAAAGTDSKNKHQRWMVSPPCKPAKYGIHTNVVPTNHLRRIRPSLWDEVKQLWPSQQTRTIATNQAKDDAVVLDASAEVPDDFVGETEEVGELKTLCTDPRQDEETRRCRLESLVAIHHESKHDKELGFCEGAQTPSDTTITAPRWDASRFVTQLKKKLTAHNADGTSFFDWKLLGNEAGVCYNAIPSRVTFLSGPLENCKGPEKKVRLSTAASEHGYKLKFLLDDAYVNNKKIKKLLCKAIEGAVCNNLQKDATNDQIWKVLLDGLKNKKEQKILRRWRFELIFVLE